MGKQFDCGAAAVVMALVLVVASCDGAVAGGPHDTASASGKSLTIGGIAVIKPKYEGSDEHDVVAIPMIVPRFSGEGNSRFSKLRKRVSFKGLDDIRFKAFGRDRFEFGPVAGYRSGREQDDARRLNGLGDVDGGLVLGGYAGIHVGAVLLDVSATTQVTGDDTGLQVRFGAESKRQVSSRVKATARVGTTLASDDYMQSFFGITPAQSAASGAGLPVFNADGGIKDVHVELGAEIDVGERWLLKLGGRYARLVGDAANSPVIETEDQLSGRIGLGYRFNLNR